MPYTIRYLPSRDRPGESWAKIDRHGHVILRATKEALFAVCSRHLQRKALAFIANVNPLRRDPTRTGLIQRQFENDLRRRFRRLRDAVWDFMVTKDALALKERTSLVIMAQEREFEFRSDAGKLEAFNDWFRQQSEASVTSEGTGKYIDSAFKRGMGNAFQSSRQGEFSESMGVGDQTKEQFIRSAFQQPESAAKVQMLATRSFEDLKGITASMSSKMNQILSQGMIDGKGAEAIAGEMFDKIKSLGESRALTIARTEVIRAHAEGQLDAFDDLGIDELGVKAEWSTAGDDRVCEECAANEGKTFSVEEARGLIPLHPNCRCTWVPSMPKEEKKEKGKRSKGLESVKGIPDDIKEAWNKARRDLTAAKKAGASAEEIARLKEIEKAAKRAAFKAGRELDKTRPAPAPKPTPTPTPAPAPAPTGEIVPAVPTPATPPVPTTKSPPPPPTKFKTAKEYREAILKGDPEKQAALEAAQIKRDKAYADYQNARDSFSPETSRLEQEYFASNTELALARTESELRATNHAFATLTEKKSLTSKVSVVGIPDEFQATTKQILGMMPADSFTKQEIKRIERVFVSRASLGSSLNGEYTRGTSELTVNTTLKGKQAQLTFAHEYGHHISYQSSFIYGKQQRLFDSRTVGETKKQFPSYANGVMGKKDRWGDVDDIYSVYAGRVYDDGRTPEVIAVGVEQLMKHPVKFAKEDPEWFDAIVGALKLLPQGN